MLTSATLCTETAMVSHLQRDNIQQSRRSSDLIDAPARSAISHIVAALKSPLGEDRSARLQQLTTRFSSRLLANHPPARAIVLQNDPAIYRAG
jgi:hypothetical protein